MTDPINPAYYDAAVWTLAEKLGFNRGNAVKYISRAGKKDPEREVEDLRKAIRYLEHEIEQITSLTTVSNVRQFIDEIDKMIWPGSPIVSSRNAKKRRGKK